MHFAQKLDHLEKRFEELTGQMADPAVISDADQYRKVTKAQSELSEVVSRAEPRDLQAFDADSDFAVGEDEEADAAHRSLLDDRHTGSELSLLDLARELPQLAAVEAAEQRDAREVVGDCWHVAIIAAASPVEPAGFTRSEAGTNSDVGTFRLRYALLGWLVARHVRRRLGLHARLR